jgi:parallel beta-helix repeat protein
MKKLLIPILSIIFYLYSVYAQDTIHIPLDYPTIQEGINASVNGDIILVHPGSYYENFNFSGKLITVASLFLTTQDTNYIFQTIIEGDTYESVVFNNGEDSTAKLIGFTIQNDSIPQSSCGAISCVNSSPLIMNNRIINNKIINWEFEYGITRGGGIYCINSSAIILNNIIKNNLVWGFWQGYGGGIYCENSALNIKNNKIVDNVVEATIPGCGGGIYCKKSSPNIEGNYIVNNKVGAQSALGGGIFCHDSSSLIITNNVISYNKCSGYFAAGGGICCFDYSTAIIIGNNINGNSSEGIYSQDMSSMIIIDNVISDNRDEWGGAGCGIISFSPIEIFRHNTITYNGDPGGGYNDGLWYSSEFPLIIDSCIISNNIGCGVRSNTSALEIHNCNISGNSQYGVFNETSIVIYAEYNWWGDASGPYHPILNPDGLGDAVSDSVLFEPWLTQPIPVELVSFTATTQAGTVILYWSTATEANNHGFEIERKIIEIESEGEWTTIGFREGYGTTTEPKEYSYVDDIRDINVKSISYRLKQIDYDGSYKYSEEVFVDNPAPIDYSLQQNYPNPFNPNTKIKYSIPQTSKVVIIVFAVLGNEIETLVNEEKSAGTYEITWFAEGLPSGIYFYRIQAGSFVETKKMVLIK